MKWLLMSAAFIGGIALGSSLRKVPAIFHDEPLTPDDFAPRFRRWVNGVEVFDREET